MTKFLDWSRLNALANNKIKVTEILKIIFEGLENIVRKCSLPPFSPFPTIFSKGFSVGVIKSRDYVVKS